MSDVLTPAGPDVMFDVEGAVSAAQEPDSPSRPWFSANFGEALEWGARIWGDRDAVIYGEQRLSFARFATRVRSFARGLVAMGVQPGDKVALWMGDRPEWLVARWAVPMIGAILVPVNTRWRDADVGMLLAQSDTSTLILQDGACGTRFIDILGEIVPDYASQPRAGWSCAALPALRRVIGFAGRDQGDPHAPPPREAVVPLPTSIYSFECVERCGADRIVAAALACAPGPDAAQWVAEAAASGPDEALRKRMQAVGADDVAQILFTAGTLAQPRGAMQPHGTLLQNTAYAARCFAMTTADRYLSCVPLFTAPGTGFTLASWIAGGAVVLIDEFTPALFCDTVERERITVTFFVDTFVHDLQAFPTAANYDLSSLRTGTGLPLPTSDFKWITKKLGVPQLVSVYGLCEACGAVTRSHASDPLAKRANTNGRPVEGVRLRIADIATGQTLPSGVVGEICVSGRSMMKGYYKHPEDNQRVFDPEGWFHTGDLGELDADGFLVYRGRVRDLIRPAGFNVAAQEIEAFLETSPAVREAIVVGVPDARFGEVPYAFVEPNPGSDVDAEALKLYCRRHIAGYKVPVEIETLSVWPAGPDGKPHRPELRARAQAARMAAGGTYRRV